MNTRVASIEIVLMREKGSTTLAEPVGGKSSTSPTLSNPPSARSTSSSYSRDSTSSSLSSSHGNREGSSEAPVTSFPVLRLLSFHESLSSSFQSILDVICVIAMIIRSHLSPFVVFVFLFHILLFVELTSLILEEFITQIDMATPPSSTTKFTTTTGWRQNYSRAKLRLESIRTRFGSMPLIILLACVFVVGSIITECCLVGRTQVPFLRDEIDHWKQFNRYAHQLILLFLESISALLQLHQCASHLFPIPLFPSTLYHSITLHLSKSFQPQQRPFPHKLSYTSLELDPVWVRTSSVEFLIAFVSCAQSFLLILIWPTYSFKSVSMYIVLWTIKSRVVNLKALYSNMLEYVNRLAMIEQSFPFRGWDEDDEEWICVICFDGEAEGVAGKKRCSLKCSHQYHIVCRLKWLKRQNFCPICHASVLPPPPPATAPPVRAPPVVDWILYPDHQPRPGSRARRRPG